MKDDVVLVEGDDLGVVPDPVPVLADDVDAAASDCLPRTSMLLPLAVDVSLGLSANAFFPSLTPDLLPELKSQDVSAYKRVSAP